MTAALRAAVLLCLFAFVLPQLAHAEGTEFTLNGHDLAVTVDARWTGGAHGGYYPIRIRVVNRGEQRNLTFRFETERHDPLPNVERTVGAPQNATLNFTLNVPLVSRGSNGVLNIYANGRFLEGMSRSLSIASPDYGSDRPSLLVISPRNVDAGPFESAVTSMVSATSGMHPGHYGGGRTENHVVVPPTLLPDSWIGYTAVDFVATPLSVLAKLPLEERTALLGWVEAGGNLIIYDIGQPAAESPELTKLLDLNNRAAVSPEWEKADPQDHRAITVVQTDQHGNPIQETAVVGGALTTAEQPATPAKAAMQWKTAGDTFARRQLMLGYVYAMPDDPFPGTPHDWAWLLRSVGPNHYHWTTRHGLSSRQKHDEFLQFLIPGIGGVPVYAFLVLISLFAVTIGPLNYFILWKRKRLALLILTIPAIAIATSAALFAYSSVAHGFGVKSRVRSLTLVDQQAKTAVSTARVALYAGLAPTGGLQFSSGSEGSAATAVFPVWPQDESFEGGRVDWSETQALESGWLRSRTRTQFVVTTVRPERGRLEIQPGVNGRLPVSNGFEQDLQALIVADADRALYYAADLPAGGSTELTKLTPEQAREFQRLLDAHPPQLPEGLSSNNVDFDFAPRMRHYYYGGHLTLQFSRGMLEDNLRYLRGLGTGANQLPRNTYVGLFRDNPGIELGVPRTTERASLHAVYGRF